MAGEKISQLPAIVTPLITDIFPVVQAGVTYKETFNQLATLFLPLSSLPLAVANGGTGVTTSTGTGSTVLSNSPTLVTPTLGAAIATSLAFSPTTSGIIGTTTNNDAAAGKVGEYISSNILIGSAVSLTSTMASNITSISLTAGDWDVEGVGALAPAAGTTLLQVGFAINSTSATFPTLGTSTPLFNVNNIGSVANQSYTAPTGRARISLASTTTIYLVALATFGTSTMAAYGFIGARRVR